MYLLQSFARLEVICLHVDIVQCTTLFLCCLSLLICRSVLPPRLSRFLLCLLLIAVDVLTSGYIAIMNEPLSS